jgi:hypothetical protein
MKTNNKSSAPKPEPASPDVDPWEVESIHQQLPTHSRDEIEQVTGECKKEARDKNRRKVLDCVRRKVS